MREGLGLCALVGRALRSGTEATTPSDSGDVRALAPGVLGRQCDMCVLAHVYSTLLVRLQRHLYRPRVYVSTVYAPTGRSPDTPRRAAPESRVTSVARPGGPWSGGRDRRCLLRRLLSLILRVTWSTWIASQVLPSGRTWHRITRHAARRCRCPTPLTLRYTSASPLLRLAPALLTSRHDEEVAGGSSST